MGGLFRSVIIWLGNLNSAQTVWLHADIRLIINWRALCKPAPSDYFTAIFQVALNRLKFGMSTLFVLKNVPVFFFHERGSKASNTFLKVHPPPLPSISNCVKDTCKVFWSSKIEILHCLETDREGGVFEFDAILSIFFCILEKKKRRFFNTKGVEMPNFSRFWATWKIATK